MDRTYARPDLFSAGAPLEHLADLLDAPETAVDAIGALLESPEEFARRRNGFLDHLLARFGERIEDYTLLIHDQRTRRAYGPDKLIRDKIRFLRFLPEISAGRGHGIDYRRREAVCGYRNRSGAGERLRRLLGLADLRAHFSISLAGAGEQWAASYRFVHPETGEMLIDTTAVGSDFLTAEAAQTAAWQAISMLIERAEGADHYREEDGKTVILGSDGEALATVVGMTAAAFRSLIAERLDGERLYVVEHILLRPKFPGDALMDVCLAEDCQHHGLEDPYSFRITYLLPADVPPFSEDMALRRYADRLIRRETPVHLLPKLCWISDAKGESEYSPEELEVLYDTCRCPAPDDLSRQLSRFEAAWCPWLEANAAFAWTELNDELEARVLDWLPQPGDLARARLLLGYFGEIFHAYVTDLVATETDPATVADTWLDTVWPEFTVVLDRIGTNDPGLLTEWKLPDPARLNDLRALFAESYTDWIDVSVRLRRLLNIFQSLRNAYPTATLHDCDDGDDENPVRLDQTSLGTF